MNLPTEIWWQIFEYTSLPELAALSECCREFSEITNYIMTHTNISLKGVYVPPELNKRLMRMYTYNADCAYILGCRYLQANQNVCAWRCFDSYFALGGEPCVFEEEGIMILGTFKYLSKQCADTLLTPSNILVCAYIHMKECMHMRIIAIDEHLQYDVVISQYDNDEILNGICRLFPDNNITVCLQLRSTCRSTRKEHPNEFSFYVAGWNHPRVPEIKSPYLI